MPKLFVIAGHGAGDPGAVGNGYNEADLVRRLAKRIKELGGDNVILGDMSRNYYADNGISKLDIPKDYELLELHMDSASSSAKGAHVIIKEGYNPDKYDKKLAENLIKLFPGRSQSIVNRGNLANPNRAAAKGYSYRLAEVGFITNAGDVSTFTKRLDEVAEAILNAFDIKAKTDKEVEDMTVDEFLNTRIQTASGGSLTIREYFKWIQDDSKIAKDQLTQTKSAANDGTTGNLYGRVCYIDKRVREIEAKLDQILKKL